MTWKERADTVLENVRAMIDSAVKQPATLRDMELERAGRYLGIVRRWLARTAT